ncbi:MULTISPECIES: DUF2783 domain-containing protein [Bradyrhizobium]|jgi:hypothetical protein|uniref:DUF2783 domain-containing protein n=1 Tax=Bradyrhizobium denitrificans TaxID=2734912 RepID=A0ABS5GEQ0_9BRAD|nr:MULTISPECIES: DUF2783 domain-containing protein [Bradyrhizobium]MBR1139821.1 DUF2783 domain-containing protein [Bradyrhizobium denitrificans]MDU0959455.1 DUF2783 domain-containing protein [Bradyrhizobium sp.]MDU1493852.1 DUF2783 domain-containing protein [Bradyrhizobium sp.]MDU1545559.1 DUF2783 domain-containing protein [Bradyrhizobium sp.]MDU1668111.1 DUF2783 domain-containing protein [Bradyrhizobium sp.]
MSLTLTPNINDPDGFYAELIGSQRDLSEEDALRMNARLVLLLANHIGDRTILSEAIRLARAPGG